MSERGEQLLRAWDALTCAILGHRWADWWVCDTPIMNARGDVGSEPSEVRTCARCLHSVARPIRSPFEVEP